MNSRLKSVLKFLFFFGLGIFLIWISVRNLSEKDKTEIANSLRQANYNWLFLSVLIGAFSNIIRAIRWKMLLAPLNHFPKTSNTFFGVMVGYFANYAFPRLGEISRCGILTRYEKIPFEQSLGTVIVERIVDVLCFFLIAGIVFLIQFQTMFSYLKENFFEKIVVRFSGNSMLLILCLCCFIFIVIMFFVLRKKMSALLGAKAKKIIAGFTNGLRTIARVKSPFWFVFHSLFIWLCYYIMFYVCFFSLPETGNVNFNAVITSFLLGTVMVMVTPGGIGAYPLAVQGVLVFYLVSSNTGYALGWLAWICQFVSNVAFGALSLFLLPLLNKEKNASHSSIPF